MNKNINKLKKLISSNWPDIIVGIGAITALFLIIIWVAK